MLRSVTLPEPSSGWPLDLPLLHHVRTIDLAPTATILVGDNGTGKSTLLESIALAAELPTVGRYGRAADDPTLAGLLPLADRLRLDWSARRYGGDLDARSHGEAFLSFFRSRLVGPGLYLLDEPEAALSPVRQLALLVLLKEASSRGAQFLVATHAPILTALPGARVLEWTHHGLAETDWRDLGHVDLLRSFLNDPDAYLRALETA